jgi:hypothetical protein
VRVSELISCDTDAWTAIVRRHLGAEDVSVIAADATALSSKVFRYRLALAGQSDPITLIAKHTSAREAAFYRDVAPRLGFLTAHCWFSHIYRRDGWVVLDDVPDHRPPATWTETDHERVLGNLANLHAAFWNRGEELIENRWLDWHVLPLTGDAGLSLPKPHRYFSYRQSGLVSSHAFANLGPLAPRFMAAAGGVETLASLGGWPGVIALEHLEVFKELLDDPVPMLHTLRSLPATLIHGAPGPRHWRLTVFGDCTLMDWSAVALGPGVLDLMAHIELGEQFHCLAEGQASAEAIEQRIQLLTDGYLLRLYEALWPLVDTRALRRALPAARCLYLLAEWLPRLGDWFAPLAASATSRPALRMDDRQLTKAGQREAVHLRPYLTGLFKRFWDDYKLI